MKKKNKKNQKKKKNTEQKTETKKLKQLMRGLYAAGWRGVWFARMQSREPFQKKKKKRGSCRAFTSAGYEWWRDKTNNK